jgi:DNA (cytosine-5)-methyltransferase 1
MTAPEESDERNKLILEAVPIVQALRPRVVVGENVAALLNRAIKWHGRTETVVRAFADGLAGYRLFAGVVEMADYGIPQMRKRLILVAIREDERILPRLEASRLLPWPCPTHAEQATLEQRQWITMREWFERMNYRTLDARTNPADPDFPLHFVPAYPEGDHRYTLVSSTPPYSGQNAYENNNCPMCGQNSIPVEAARCPHCNAVLFNRPVTLDKNTGAWRLVRGFGSSYRRASPNQPAPTVTTNSSHLGSDNKIHPWENRVLSILECADLQTVPRFYDWSWALETKHSYVIRNTIGEALPPYFTYLHGQVLIKLLAGILPKSRLSRLGVDRQERSFSQPERQSE